MNYSELLQLAKGWGNFKFYCTIIWRLPKIEANANRYTFVWRGSLNYHLAGLLDTIDALYTKYNTFLLENGYGTKYDLGDAQMFVIEGMDKVRKVIEENRNRKLTKHKKISNNTSLRSITALHLRY